VKTCISLIITNHCRSKAEPKNW